MRYIDDPNECVYCYHDRSQHTPECQECLSDLEETDPCPEFGDYSE